MLHTLDDIVRDNFEVDGPRWNQKYYVSYRVGNYNWLYVNTTPSILHLNFLVSAKAFDADEIAQKLGIVKFDKEEPMSEKLGLPSSVLIVNRNENTDRVTIRVKEDFDLESKAFLDFLQSSYAAFPK